MPQDGEAEFPKLETVPLDSPTEASNDKPHLPTVEVSEPVTGSTDQPAASDEPNGTETEHDLPEHDPKVEATEAAETAAVTDATEIGEHGAEKAEKALDGADGAETKPVDTKPVETKPVEAKPAEAKPAEAKPAEAKPETNAGAKSTTSPVQSPPATPSRRRRTASIALSTSSVDGTVAKSSMLFISNAMQVIKKSKDARRIPVLNTAVTNVLTQLEEQQHTLPSPAVIMEPLRIVCAQASSTDLRITALDCIGKLFTFAYLDDEVDTAGPPQPPLLDRAIDIVCDTFEGESTDSRIELQIIKALTAAVVNDELVAHGPALLKAVRQIYNIFVTSRSQANQGVAQVSLTQMVQAVFSRAKELARAETNYSSTVSVGTSGAGTSATAVSTRGHSHSSSDAEAPTLTLEKMKGGVSEEDPTGSASADLITQDAFLLFRTLCKLSEKTDVNANDIKGHGMRSKLLSLHLIHIILKGQISVFAAKDLKVKFRNRNLRFVDSVKDYLSSTLSRNAASISPPVFEISAEIFSLIVTNLRSEFKREIEVFFSEIYLTIAEMRTSTVHQKMYVLNLLSRLCSDPRALVELYLNYDCSVNSKNIFENLIGVIVRLAVVKVQLTQSQYAAYYQERNHPLAVYNLNLPPSMAISHVVATNGQQEQVGYPREYAMKVTAIEALVSVLRSLLVWSQRDFDSESAAPGNSSTSSISSTSEEKATSNGSSSAARLPVPNGHARNLSSDDPSQFETLKSSKKALDLAISDFNYKPEKGVDQLLAAGIISALEPDQVAKVLLENEGFDKGQLGEYMGGKDAFNRAVMHHFADQMDFKDRSYVEALRLFMQKFRLPGEGQVVDRYVLEFANKYFQDNPTVFPNASTPYTLGYSVMLLNTELHNPQIKRKRMTLEDFIMNNRGINDGLDLPDDYLAEIYKEIRDNEIKIISEQQQAAIRGHTAEARDSREAYLVASEVIMSKAAKMMKSADRGSESVYYNASHVDHVRPMFEVTWMSLLAGVSAPFTDGDSDIVHLCLEGIALAIRVACHFEIELARISFVQTLVKFTTLTIGSIKDLTFKNVEAVQVLLRTALVEGNMLHSSWYDILVTVSQLERVQLIASGVAAGTLPDVGSIRMSSDRYVRDRPLEYVPADVSEPLRSRELVVDMDKIFTQSAALNAEAIVEFVRALARVSQEEIDSSTDMVEPRTFSLQKMVDVCYYNMGRIKMEWSKIWDEMGRQFNAVTCGTNEHVVWFALDSLRQLSMRFLDLEELPHFRFQQAFLNPFVYAMQHSSSEQAKGLVVECLRQMVMAKPDQLRSGWTAIFSTIQQAASQEKTVVVQAFDLLSHIGRDYLPFIVEQDALAPFLAAGAAMGKQGTVKVALHAIDLLRKVEEAAAKTSADPKAINLLVLPSLHDVAMHGRDLEVRGRALTYLFDVLMNKGDAFTREDWDYVGREQLFPLFTVLEIPKSKLDEETNLWLSTTLIQALRQLIVLFGQYFTMLESTLDTFFLDLLKTCICQENETVSRIGSQCLQELVANNAERFTDKHWQQIVDKVELLFRHTTANELFDASLLASGNTRSKTQVFHHSITLTVQQILVIDTAGELLRNKSISEHMPVADAVRISQRLKASYDFARSFNHNHELRQQLFQQGYMKQTPNLLMQESAAARNYVTVTMALYRNKPLLESEPETRQELREELLPLCTQILSDYNQLAPSDHRHVKTLTPIVVIVLQEFVRFDDDDFKNNIDGLYRQVIDVLNKDMGRELREGVQSVLLRVADVHLASGNSG